MKDLSLLLFVIAAILLFATAGKAQETNVNRLNLRGKEALDYLRQNNFSGAPQEAAAQAFVEQGKLVAADGAAQDNLGFAVAVSGDTAVVGAPRASGGTGLQNRGAAYVFARSGGVWTFRQKLTPSDGSAGDQFGYSVAIAGDTVAVGRQNTVVGANRADGKVYIFTRAGNVWAETQTIVSDDLAQGDLFGNALAFEGDTLAVSAFNKNNGATFFQGAVYVFTRSGAGGQFSQQAKLVSTDGGLADFFGYSVALSGETIVVGTPGQVGSGAGGGRGWAYVYVRSGTTWTFQQKLTAADGAAGDAFGFSVAVSGETAVVGARLDMIGTTGGQGSAYVFTRSGGVWSEQQKLVGVEITQRNDNFGYAVAIKGDTVAVGSPAHEIVSGIANHGAVYIFTRSGGAWARTGKLIHKDPAPDALGQALAFDGDSLLAGAPAKNSNRGAAYIFNAVSTNGQAKLVPPEVFANSLFGFWLGMSDDTLAVGSNFGTYIYTRRGANWEFTQRMPFFTENGGATNILPNSAYAFSGDMMIVGAAGARINNVSLRGAVLVYQRNASGIWVEQQRLLASDGAAGDQFGASLAVSGNTLVVGAEGDAVGANGAQGSAYVFTLNGSTWTEQQKITASDGAANDRFGREAAISGETIVVGVSTKTVGSNSGQGAAYVYQRNGSTWTEQQKLLASDGGFNHAFGGSVAIENDTVAIGAQNADVGTQTFQGAAYVFTRSGAVWTEQEKLFDPNGSGGDQFGIDLALSGDRLIIGANGADYAPNWASMGAVYVYRKNGQTWQRRGKIYPYDPDHNKGLGFRLAIVGDRVAATAVSENNYGVTGSGAAYVFDLTQIRFAAPEFDFDGDGRSDYGVFRPSERNWYLNRSSAGFAALQFGLATDRLTPADFDGDGRTDFAVWREGTPNAAGFYIFQSSDNTVRFEPFGQTGDEAALVGDWDGDGRADPAVYREGAQGFFYFRGSNNNPNGNLTFVPWGAAGDRAVRGDFDGDGRQDAAVFRPSNSAWYILQSSDLELRVEFWGLPTDKFVPADYDGDGKTDPAVFRSGTWYIKQSSDNQPRYEFFGLSGDALVPADYDGDGKADPAVFRSGTWYVRRSSDAEVAYLNFGLGGDAPLPNAFVR